MRIGLQTFTVRQTFQTKNDREDTLKRLKAMGILDLELAYIPWNEETIASLEESLPRHGMRAFSSQIKWSVINKRFEEIMDYHRRLNIQYMAVAVIPFRRLLFGNYGLKKFAEELNTLGKATKKHGVRLLFHHHNYEFFRFPKGMALDLLIKHIDPEYVGILCDTYWVHRGGFGWHEFFTTYENHIEALHLRGYHKKSDDNLLDTPMEVGQIIEYALNHTFGYIVIEQDTKQPFSDIKKSVTRIKNEGYVSQLGGNKHV